MTLSEFKAWFEGFTEGMDGPPSLKQWERIQARVKEISGQPVTQTVFVDRYWPTIERRWAFATNNVTGAQWSPPSQNMMMARCGGTQLGPNGHMTKFDEGVNYDSHAAMNALGRSDAEALKAA